MGVRISITTRKNPRCFVKNTAGSYSCAPSKKVVCLKKIVFYKSCLK